MAGSQVVEFRKQIDSSLVYDTIGESVGFFRFSATAAKQLSNITEQYVANGEREAPCEEAIRDLLLSDDMLIEIEDITGLPWIEIDFPEDIDRATKNVLPHINANSLANPN